MEELVHQNHFVVYLNTFMVFEYLCNQANTRVNQVFVSALFSSIANINLLASKSFYTSKTAIISKVIILLH